MYVGGNPGVAVLRHARALLQRSPRIGDDPAPADDVSGFVQNDLAVTRQTAAKYLDQLAAAGFIEKHQAGRNNYYINHPQVDLLMRPPASR